MNAASIARALDGRKRGSAWTARCPAHDDHDPSLSISISKEGKTLVHCHAGCSQDHVIDALTKLGLWHISGEYQNRRPRAAHDEFQCEAERRALAFEIWKSTVSANGTLTQTYLAIRAINLPMAKRLRFHNALGHTPSGTVAPAMVALVTDFDDRPLAVHRTYLKRDGSDKADVKPPRITLGACRGGGVRLGVVSSGQWLVVAEENANPDLFRYADALGELKRRCPDYVAPSRWQQCIEDAERFIAQWGAQAEALEWSSGDLFALHAPPEQPHPSYQRLSRYDATGLIWILEGHRVVALSSNTAVVAGHTGSILKHYKIRSEGA